MTHNSQQKPYNRYETEASVTLSQAMSLCSFSITCQLAGLDPIKQLKLLAENVKLQAQNRASVSEAADVVAAYERVTEDAQTIIFRDLLLAKEALESFK